LRKEKLGECTVPQKKKRAEQSVVLNANLRLSLVTNDVIVFGNVEDLSEIDIGSVGYVM
jgi:hypothetical protein